MLSYANLCPVNKNSGNLKFRFLRTELEGKTKALMWTEIDVHIV